MPPLSPHRLLVGLACLSLSAPSFAQEPSVATVPQTINQTPAEEKSIFSDLQWEFILNTTTRWQVDNGNRTGFLQESDSYPSCTMDSDCADPGAICFQGQCRRANPEYDPTGENVGDFLTTFGGSITWKSFVATARFDTNVYFNVPEASPNASRSIQKNLFQRYESQFQAEYLSLVYAGRNVELTLGDFYVTLGKGLTLAVRKVADVGVDNKIRGAEARLKLGSLKLHAFGGLLNIKNFEPGTGFIYKDLDDIITGARAEYRYKKYIKAGIHGAYIQHPRLQNTLREFYRYGATIELPRPVKWLSAYAEISGFERKDTFTPFDATQIDPIRRDRTNGLGLYSNMTLFLGPATILLEGKAYDNLENIFPGGDLADPDVSGTNLNASEARDTLLTRKAINLLIDPPTAERLRSIVLSNITIAGGRFRADWRINRSVVPYLSVGHFRVEGEGLFGLRNEATNGLAKSEKHITPAFGGVQLRWTSGQMSAEAGYRGRFETSDGSLVRADTHLLVDMHQHLMGKFSTEVFFDGRHVEETTNEWVEGRASVSLLHQAGWSLTGAYEFYTGSTAFNTHYPSIAGQYQLNKNLMIRALAGGERAGLKCSGGVCRFFPGFEGGRLEINLRI